MPDNKYNIGDKSVFGTFDGYAPDGTPIWIPDEIEPAIVHGGFDKVTAIPSGLKPWAPSNNGLSNSGNYTTNKYEGNNSGGGTGQNKVGDSLAKGLSIATGLINIGSIASQAGRTNDINPYLNQIKDVEEYGRQGFSSYDDVISAYDMQSRMPNVGIDGIRGMTTGQKLGSIGSAAGAGASAGSVLGPLGAAGGAVIGAGAGLLGVLSGNARARIDKSYLDSSKEYASATLNANANAGMENLLNNQNRNSISRAMSRGGNLDKRQLTISEFAAKKLKKPSQISKENTSGVQSGVQRIYCNGGVKIRFKR